MDSDNNVVDFREIALAKATKECSSLEEYADVVWNNTIDEIKRIEAGTDLSLERNPRLHKATCRLGQFVGDPWKAWSKEKIVNYVTPLAAERCIDNYENAIENAIEWGAANPAKVPKALRKAKVNSAPWLRNYNWEEAEGEDGKEGKKFKTPKTMNEIIEEIHEVTGGWPKSVGGRLFVCRDNAIIWLTKGARVEAWLESEHFRLDWCDSSRGRKMCTTTRLLEGLELVETHRYETLERCPHHPPIKGAFYTCQVEDGDGRTLDAFLDLLNPDTYFDKLLLLAAIVTPSSGVGAGCRPAFLLTSAHGRGVGKTATAEAITRIYRGSIKVSPDEKWEKTQERLLTDAAFEYRCVLVDNIKGKLDAATTEAAITSQTISGRKMYVGNADRPNYMTWFMTANSPALSTDLADRAVVIRIGRAKHNVDFAEKIAPYMPGGSLYLKLLGDIQAFLKGPIVCDVVKDRFSPWQKAVLCRIACGDRLADVIIQRRREHDEEADEIVEVAAAIETFVQRNSGGLQPGENFIPGSDLMSALRPVWNDLVTPKLMWNRLGPLLGNGDLANARKARKRPSSGGGPVRGVVWAVEEI